MKQLVRALSAVLALMLLLGCAMAEENTDADLVLFTVNGEEIRKSEVDKILLDMVQSSYTDSLADYDTAIDQLARIKLIDAKVAQMGFDQYTAEEEEAFENEAQAQWDEAIDEYVTYFLAEDTDEARAQAKKDAEAYYASNGYTKEAILDNLKWNDGYNKLQAACVTVTDEDIQAEFAEAVAYYQSVFENDIVSYEYYQSMGYEMLYTPAGYRGITHILLKVDEELLNAYTEAQAALEEAVHEIPGEGTEAAKESAKPVTQEDVEAARKAVVNSCQQQIDDIYQRLEAGEAFEALIAEYGNDPGMESEEMLKEGYAVHRDSVIWDPAFTGGAFSDKMLKPGDVSDPVVGSYGVHILYYLRDIPSGAVELTDDLREELKSNLISERFYDEQMKWMDGAVVYNQENIDAAKAAAAAAEQQAMEAEDNADAE